MPFNNKVIWKEGMFIRAQHFQQTGRYFESYVRGRVSGLRSYGWGLTDLVLNRELLATGRFAIERAAGVFEDGTPFAVPDDADHPAPLRLPENARNCIVYLTVPISQPGGYECDDALSDSNTRFTIVETDVSDSNVGHDSTAPIAVGKLRLGYRLETSDCSGFQCIGIARVVEVRADNTVVLDDRYVPPTLDVQVSPFLSGLLTEIVGLLNHRGEALAARLSAGSAGTAGELLDTLLLQTINRWQPVFEHLSNCPTVHPETMFLHMVALAGELATLTHRRRRALSFPNYRHEQLQPTFEPIMLALRSALSTVLEQTAIQIPLTEHRYGIKIAQVPDRSIFEKYAFVLTVKADLPAELILRSFSGQVKIGPVEHIRELVQSALPGITLRHLPVAPRQIPHHTGKSYFELDRATALWRQVATSSGLAIHVAGDYPGLALELWAIKD